MYCIEMIIVVVMIKIVKRRDDACVGLAKEASRFLKTSILNRQNTFVYITN